ncbi:MAG: OmpW family outer membrane protein [Thermodesulfobacteriota bacterium]|nr:OmpW family outer membrane protein [Thermodesulfobacteriota bacterium]
MMKGLKKAGGLMAILVAVSLILVGAYAPAYAMEGDSPWLVRLRALAVVPDEESTDITQIGGEAEVDDAFTAELDISYFFTENIAAEMIFGVADHDVEAVDTAVGDVDLGDVWLLPPTLTLQYHFMPAAQFRPYVGAGINYTIFFGEDEGDADDIEYDDGFGFALQAGFDWGLNDKWAINVDVKKIWLETDVAVDALNTTVETEVDLDPWFIGVGVAYKF